MNNEKELEHEIELIYPYPDFSKYENKGRIEELRYEIDKLEISKLRAKYILERTKDNGHN